MEFPVPVQHTGRRRRFRTTRPAANGKTHSPPCRPGRIPVLPGGVRPERFQYLAHAHRLPEFVVSPQVTRFGRILEPQFEGVHAQLSGHFIHHTFNGKGSLRRSRRPVSTDGSFEI